MKIVLTRHATTNWNVAGRVQGATDVFESCVEVLARHNEVLEIAAASNHETMLLRVLCSYT